MLGLPPKHPGQGLQGIHCPSPARKRLSSDTAVNRKRMEQTSLGNRREAEAPTCSALQSPPHGPRPSSCQHDSIRSESAQAPARSRPCSPPPPKSGPWGASVPPSDLYMLTSTSPARDNNTLSTWKSRLRKLLNTREGGISCLRSRVGRRSSGSSETAGDPVGSAGNQGLHWGLAHHRPIFPSRPGRRLLSPEARKLGSLSKALVPPQPYPGSRSAL